MVEQKIRSGQDLRQDGQRAAADRIPLLLYFSQQFCGYCERLEDEILVPMILSGQYSDRIILRRLSIDPGEEVIGFDGRKLDNRMLFHEYDGLVTPTLVLTDEAGRPLTKPLAGINTVEYFGWYLDNSIDTANRAMKNSDR